MLRSKLRTTLRYTQTCFRGRLPSLNSGYPSFSHVLNSLGGNDHSHSRRSLASTFSIKALLEYSWIDGAECLRLYKPGGYHPLMINDLLQDRYRIVDKLGYGGYSTVWLAHDERLKRYVAIKIGIATPSITQREVSILRTLSTSPPASQTFHTTAIPDAIPIILDEFEVEGPNGTHVCYAMAPAQGNLREASFSRVFPIAVARALAAKLAIAVCFVHSRGFVHGDIHLRNALIKCPSISDDLSIDQFRDKFGEPDAETISRYDGKPLTKNVPPQAVIPMYLGKMAEGFTLADAQGLILSDFGEAFAPAREQRLGKDCHTPVCKRAPETFFEPNTPISYPSDIWSLGVAIWEILGMKAIFSESEPLEDIPAQQIDVLGSDNFPAKWLADWDKWQIDHGIADRPMDDRWPPLEEAFEECIQEFRKEKEESGIFGEEEKHAILDLMRRMLNFRPEDRLTIEEVLRSEWMVKWAMPELRKS